MLRSTTEGVQCDDRKVPLLASLPAILECLNSLSPAERASGALYLATLVDNTAQDLGWKRARCEIEI